MVERLPLSLASLECELRKVGEWRGEGEVDCVAESVAHSDWLGEGLDVVLDERDPEREGESVPVAHKVELAEEEREVVAQAL